MRKYILLTALVISFVFLYTPVIHSAEEEEKDRLLVIPLKALSGVNKDEAYLLTGILSTVIHRSGKFTILNREDMQAVLDEKEFELAMGCDDNVCLLENVAKLAVNKIVAGNIGKLGRKFIVSIRMINEDGENEVMARESCDCPIDELDGTIEQISYKFLKYLGVEVPQDGSIRADSKPKRAKINLRSSYRDLTVYQAQSMSNISIRSKEAWGFYGHSTIKHSYKKSSINGDKVVLDLATGLMWVRSGKDEGILWKKAQKWVKKLNKRGYAGYNDWRLPTLEEAASLLESSERNGDLNIDPVFNNKQKSIWTGDRKESSRDVWNVNFYDGSVRCLRRGILIASLSYVRPVRSLK